MIWCSLLPKLAWLGFLPLVLVNYIYLAVLTDRVDGTTLGALAAAGYLLKLVAVVNGPFLLTVMAALLLSRRTNRPPVGCLPF